MTDNELLLAISQLLDVKLDARLKPMENRLDRIETKVTNIALTLENDIRPRLNTIESCYTETYNRYKDYADKMEAAFEDIEILKKVVSENREKQAAGMRSEKEELCARFCKYKASPRPSGCPPSSRSWNEPRKRCGWR